MNPFRPTDYEVIKLLFQKLNNVLVDNNINEVEFYHHDPLDLRPLARSMSTNRVCYFYCPWDTTYGPTTRQNRKTPSGKWKVTGEPIDVKDDSGEFSLDPETKIGFKRVLAFIPKIHVTKKSEWIMHEFHCSLVPESQREYVVCRLEYKGNDTTILFDNRKTQTPNLVPNPSLVINQSLQGNSEANNTNLDYTYGIQSNSFNENFQTMPEENFQTILQGDSGFSINNFQTGGSCNVQLTQYDSRNCEEWVNNYNVEYDDETSTIWNNIRDF